MFSNSPPGILLFEPDLRDFAGHFFGYACELATVCRQRGVPLVVLTYKNISPQLVEYLERQGVTVEPAFGDLRWFGRVLLTGLRFAWVAMRAVRRYPDYVPVTLSGRIPLLYGAAAGAAVSSGFSVFQFMTWQERSESAAPLHASWLNRLVAGFGYRAGLRYACESEELKTPLSVFLDQPVYALPTISAWPKTIPEPDAVGKKPRVGLLGGGRWDKNLGQFVEAVTCAAGGLENCQVVVQVDQTFGSDTQRCKELLSDLNKSGIDLELLEYPLSGEAFIELLMSLDVLALPNQPRVAASAASGIFTQSLGLGVVPVVPAGTWMASQAELLGVGIIYEEYTSEGLRRALKRAVHERAELRQKIIAGAGDWRRQHSADVLLDKLMSLVEKE